MKLPFLAALLLAAGPAAAGTITGTFEPDRLAGGTAADTIFGGGGNDVIFGDPAAGIGTPRAMERISLGLDGKETEFGVGDFAISDDGRWLVFRSSSKEFLPPGEANGKSQIYLRDLVTGTTTLISRTATGSPSAEAAGSPIVSTDGRRIAFSTSAVDLPIANPDPGNHFIVVYDRSTNSFMNASPFVDLTGTGTFFSLMFSSDGSRLAYSSNHQKLVAGDTNGKADAFVATLDGTVTVHRASTKADGSEATGGQSYPLGFTPDGKRLLFLSESDTLLGAAAEDKNGTKNDVFEKALDTFLPNGSIAGAVTLVSSASDGSQDPMGSASGGVYSPDGREVSFVSTATGLVSGDSNGAGPDIFVKTLRNGGPRPAGTVRIVSRSATGAQAAGFVGIPAYSPDGQGIVFSSNAANLAAGADGSVYQTFQKNLTVIGEKGPVALVSRSLTGQKLQADKFQGSQTFVRDGRAIVFYTEATNLDPKDKNGFTDIYLVTLAAPVGGADVIDGGTGADRMIGSAGNDTYIVDNAGDRVVEQPGEGTDTVKSPFPGALPANVENFVLTGSAAGTLTGSAVANALTGNGAANTLKGLAANDVLAGGAGNDILDGADGADRLDGGTGNDRLIGGTGADRLSGGDGSDVIDGGTGADLLTGGGGKDRFEFRSTKDSTRAARDRITDFAGAAGDRIVLSAIDANTRKSGNQSFAFIGSKAFSGKPGQLRFAKGVLSGDVNGDRKADLSIRVTGKVKSRWIVK
jgi:Ca2+-binding RTX toxin-like protein